VGTRDPGFTTTELADYRVTRCIVVRVNGWVMGMDKVPWVGNGWVQLTPAQLWVGYGYSCQAQCRTLVYIDNLMQVFMEVLTSVGWFLK
jgi:hypothetical protein